MQNSSGISFNTAIAIVVANMIGTGVFTSLGFQTLGIQSVFVLLLLWIVGGVVALCGALSYGELAALFPRSGGEYNFLSNIYHPSLGFLSGWVSATVGFAAPVAAASIALSTYTTSIDEFSWINETLLAILVVVLLTIIHSTDVKVGGAFQRYSTAIKVALIFFFILAGFLFTSSPQQISLLPQTGDAALTISSAFFVSLAYVSFSYSGWNASAYLANEVENPRVTVPRSLLVGTIFVLLAYVLLNFVFLYTVPVGKLSEQQLYLIQQENGKPLEVGHLAADYIFGKVGGSIMAGMIALLLVSSISAMVFAGPRVTQVMGEDIHLLKILGQKNSNGIPIYAIVLQAVITIILILTSSFDSIIKYIAFTLDIFTFMTVLGVFVMRFKAPQKERVYKTWGYPITPLIFLIVTGWTMVVLLQANFWGSLAALATVLAGFLFYLLDNFLKKNKDRPS